MALEVRRFGEEPIFALDIGTHSITGIIGTGEDKMFRIQEMYQLEYPRRAMRDGQIEDIDQVAATADKIRRELEERTKITLRTVHVAAAGRALRTKKASHEMTLENKEPVTHKQIKDLESLAIQQAEEELLKEQKENDIPLYYIGHSVIKYYLDDYAISTLLNHRGQRIKVDIIATFLPGEVVESLYSAMRKIGLTVGSLTLEPIAAMNAIIPQELRMLNLALVDIGAGTSDIAVSEGGSVVAYTMATTAGDEITEAIVKEFLVDFETAEQMKLALSEKNDQIQYKDILGFSYSVRQDALREKIQSAVKNLCSEICANILEVNGKPPAAVFMVGGGSKLPGLCALVAKELSMDENRVAVGGNNYMKRLVVGDVDVSGPEFATPLGIALTAVAGAEQGTFTVTLNGEAVQMMSNKTVSVMELLLANGYDKGKLLGRSGKSIAYEIDGRKKVARGSRPTAAVITVNGLPASITTVLNENDVIEIVPAVSGGDAVITVREAVEDYNGFDIILEGQTVQVGTVVLVNGEPASPDRLLEDSDVLLVNEINTLENLLEETGLAEMQSVFMVNGLPQGGNYELQPGDEISAAVTETAPQPQAQPMAAPQQEVTEPQSELQLEPTTAPQEQPAEVQQVAQQPQAMTEAVEYTQPVQQQPTPQETAAELPRVSKMIKVTLNGERVLLPPKADKSPHLFVDMLNYVDIDPTKPEGDIVLKLNGQDASYLAQLQDGDEIDICWKK